MDCVWGAWDDPACSVACGGGTRTLTRTKLINEHLDGSCDGDSEKTEACNTNQCPSKKMLRKEGVGSIKS